MSSVNHLDAEEIQDHIAALLGTTPYDTVGQLRDAVMLTLDQCCANCIDYTHPSSEAWQELQPWLFLLDVDWRTAP